MKVLGIDYGMRRVGVAIGETETKIASPVRTLLHDTTLWQSLLDIVRDEHIECIVVGMPRSLRAPAGRSVSEERVNDFIKKLKKHLALPVKTEDERFSTRLAQRLLGGIKKTKPRGRSPER
ncbi:Holliday junction resolvase RuvX, partial [Candidatus Uhrbacteria bacterium]|nr:Holliday junction resolvase RuvX [Candidatus Uhrbacteria bacterium]